VDFEHVAKLLSEIRGAALSDVIARADEGAPKLWLINRLLEQRRTDPTLFDSSRYTPLIASGAKARHAVGFVRDRLLVVAPRLVVGLGGDWGDTAIDIPDGSWRSLLTDDEQQGGPGVPVAELTRRFPVAVLARRATSR